MRIKGYSGSDHKGAVGGLGAAYSGLGNPNNNRAGGGGCGGGFVGTGGGPANYWNTNDGAVYSTGSDRGGDSYVNANVSVVHGPDKVSPGSVVLIFS
ncbi:hypothetical protein QM012_000741 [Aureobasidium pullulans]|uniref:Uncharacterized protein n=1 Tax=Aureobasidium pullulans TaxID=5580 RepID=A0ABR0TWK8_AURPU